MAGINSQTTSISALCQRHWVIITERLFPYHCGKVVQYADDTTLFFSEESKIVLEERYFVEICVQHFNSLNPKTNTLKTNVNFDLRPVDSQRSPAAFWHAQYLSSLQLEITWNTP
ncbi:hypothetical protein J6590_033008 [Homalodisca vitripennis]|nr:hypothetical protein J6590_033008 [Homalodisca vitripennis]